MGSVRTHHFGTQNLDRTKTVSEQTACMGSMQAAKWVVLYGPRKRKKGTTDLNRAGGPGDGWTKKERKNTDFGGGGDAAFGVGPDKEKKTVLSKMRDRET